MKKTLIFVSCVLLSSFLPALAVVPAASSKSSYQATPTDKPQPIKAKIKSKPEPRCPKDASEQRVRATIVLKAIFRSTGEVTDIKFASVRPGDLQDDLVKQLSAESINAAAKIKFEPAKKDGHQVSMYVQLEYIFVCY